MGIFTDWVTLFTPWYEANSAAANIMIVLIVTCLAYLVGVLFLGRIVKRAVAAHGRNWHQKDIEKRQQTLESVLLTVWRVIVVSVGILVFIQTAFPQFDLAPLFASAGILGVALGFGAQSLVRDFLSGIFIVSENQYRVGDIVDIEGFSGTVERIGARSTVIRDVDGNVHYFPNGMVQHVINKTMGYSMSRFIFAVTPSTDIEKVIEIINRTGQKLTKEAKWKEKIIEAPKFVSLGEFTAMGVSIIVAGKTQPSDQWSVTAEMRQRLFEEFEATGIELGTTVPTVTPTAASKK